MSNFEYHILPSGNITYRLRSTDKYKVIHLADSSVKPILVILTNSAIILETNKYGVKLNETFLVGDELLKVELIRIIQINGKNNPLPAYRRLLRLIEEELDYSQYAEGNSVYFNLEYPFIFIRDIRFDYITRQVVPDSKDIVVELFFNSTTVSPLILYQPKTGIVYLYNVDDGCLVDAIDTGIKTDSNRLLVHMSRSRDYLNKARSFERLLPSDTNEYLPNQVCPISYTSKKIKDRPKKLNVTMTSVSVGPYRLISQATYDSYQRDNLITSINHDPGFFVPFTALYITLRNGDKCCVKYNE